MYTENLQRQSGENMQKNLTVYDYGEDIFLSGKLEQEKNFIQHSAITCYEHSIAVACLSLKLAQKLPMKTDKRALVRGALLHDYFLYDWHDADGTHNLHGFTHGKKALENAKRDFEISEIEADIIKKHMFPLTLVPPKYAESLIVCVADKICALKEVLYRKSGLGGKI